MVELITYNPQNQSATKWRPSFSWLRYCWPLFPRWKNSIFMLESRTAFIESGKMCDETVNDRWWNNIYIGNNKKIFKTKRMRRNKSKSKDNKNREEHNKASKRAPLATSPQTKLNPNQSSKMAGRVPMPFQQAKSHPSTLAQTMQPQGQPQLAFNQEPGSFMPGRRLQNCRQ